MMLQCASAPLGLALLSFSNCSGQPDHIKASRGYPAVAADLLIQGAVDSELTPLLAALRDKNVAVSVLMG